MFLLSVLFTVSVVARELNLATRGHIWPVKHLEKHAHLEAVFKSSPGLRLLVKCVLLLSPCNKGMKKQVLWTRLCLPWCCGPNSMRGDLLHRVCLLLTQSRLQAVDFSLQVFQLFSAELRNKTVQQETNSQTPLSSELTLKKGDKVWFCPRG